MMRNDLCSHAESNGLNVFRWPALASLTGLVHGVFTRQGGVSRPPYDSLNTAFGNGDRPEAVARNLARIAAHTGLKTLAAVRQVHGDRVVVVDEAFLERWERRKHEGVSLILGPEADALVTRLPRVGLLVRIADCQAVFLADPQRRVIANVHSGWRGSVANILGKTVAVLEERFQCRPESLVAAVSPSLGPCCAEFRNFEGELPRSFWAFQVRPTYFDFWAISRRQLVEAGLRPQNIHLAQQCTACHPDLYFSYRRDKETGRMGAVIALTQEE
ncbi:peptidoglycan editing factor PgeF [Desulfacinum hydrothermale]|nr:peptidoglycan editing factor PgeF [Desulfacinum hydrothermale]